jgi:small subunit ribosomal protein S17
MAEEEKKDTEETTEAPAEEAPEVEAPEAEAAEEAAPQAAEEAAPEAAEEAAPEEPAAEQAAPEPEAAPAEPVEVLSPKQRRKRERSLASGPAGPQRTPDERASERAGRRRAAGADRRRHRAVVRGKRGEPGTGTPEAAPDPGTKMVRQGTVVAAANDKTITVEIPIVRRHRTYEKVVRRSSRLHAHDEANSAQKGDVVRIIESRPLSRTKRWRLLDIVERSR